MTQAKDSAAQDRRDLWTIKSRPEWLAQFNDLNALVDIKTTVPLDEASLLAAATARTGLSDFGDEDGWRTHFRVLLNAIESEAKLNFMGRILTRSDLVNFLCVRLNITNAYKLHPEIDKEVITEPVFILGFGRSGTTILHEVLAIDPQFRSVRRWEAMFPWPAPEATTYETDPRVAEADKYVEFVWRISPEWRKVHAWGGDLPVEDIEFTWSAFMSEVWVTAFQIPSFEKYFEKQDVAYHLAWHKKFIKLLQWKYKKPHWLFKNPTHMPRLPDLLKAYPDAKIIIPHRDPITSNDSVVNVMGVIYSWRTDDPYGGGVGDEWMMPEPRAAVWDMVIDQIETGKLRKGFHTNVLYAAFIKDPGAVIKAMYADLGLTLKDDVLKKMLAFLDERHKGTMGNTAKYDKLANDSPQMKHERAVYKKYQDYFGVPNET